MNIKKLVKTLREGTQKNGEEEEGKRVKNANTQKIAATKTKQYHRNSFFAFSLVSRRIFD
jgi:hypothetical protein